MADEVENYRVVMTFEPAGAPDLLESSALQSIDDLAGTESHVFDSATVVGSIGAGNAPRPAMLEFARPSAVPGRAPHIITRSVPGGHSFEVVIPEAEQTLTVWCVDSADPFPPVRRVVTRAELNDDDHQREVPRIDVPLADPAAVEGAVLLSTLQRIQNLRVVAVDPATGQTISTSARTGPLRGQDVGGEFRLLLPATTDRFVIRAGETFEDQARALPTMQFAELQLSTLTFDVERNAFLVARAVTTYPAVSQVLPLSGTVEGLPGAGGRVTVGDAILRFRSTDLGDPGLADVPGTMERIEFSEPDDGTYSVSLTAGTYEVDIIPPSTSEFADLASGRVEQFVNAPDNQPQRGIVFEATSRLSVSGTVVDSFGRPVADASVELRGGAELSDVALGRDESYVRSVTVRTTADGAFLALVDPGHYDVVVRPSLETGLPWAVRMGLEVTADTSLEDPIELRPGRKLAGVVRPAQDEEPAGGTIVEVWCVTETDASLVCGRTTTDGAGRYELLLPAELPAFD